MVTEEALKLWAVDYMGLDLGTLEDITVSEREFIDDTCDTCYGGVVCMSIEARYADHTEYFETDWIQLVDLQEQVAKYVE